MILFLLFFASSDPADAGAWARQKGQVFIATGANIYVFQDKDAPHTSAPTLYAEYGLTERVTVGLSYFQEQDDTVQNGFFWGRIPIGDIEGEDRFAASLGFGLRLDENLQQEQLVQAGLSWGRGQDNGWIAVDASVTYGNSTQKLRPKLDATRGFNLADRWTAIMQIQTGEGFDGSNYFKFSPAINMKVSDSLSLNLAAVAPLKGDEADSLRLELWATF